MEKQNLIMKNEDSSNVRHSYFHLILSILIFSILDLCTTTFFQDILHTPLFFDTIFMIAALFAFGPVSALFEYVIFISLVCVKLIFLYGKTDHVYLYTLSALTIILVTHLFVRRKEKLHQGVNLTFLYILTASILAGLACSVVSGFIGYFTYNLNQKDWTFDQLIYAFNGEQFDFLASSILGRIPVIILDRIITTFAGFGLYKIYTRIMSHRLSRRMN